MNHPQIDRLRHEWRHNRRLRFGALAIAGIIGLQLILWMSDARAVRMEQYQRDAELLTRLENASRESAWVGRADAAEAILAAMRDTIPAVDSEGLAQAEVQAWLGDLAAYVGVAEPVIRVENAIAVDGQPDMLQVLARLDGAIAESQVATLMRTLAAARPWFQAERLQVQDGNVPRMSLVLRGYFRKGQAAADAARPAGLPAASTLPSRIAAPMPRVNPLAPRDPTASPGPASRPAGMKQPPGGTLRQRPAPGTRQTSPTPAPSMQRPPDGAPAPPASVRPTGEVPATPTLRRPTPTGSTTTSPHRPPPTGGGGRPPTQGGGAS